MVTSSDAIRGNSLFADSNVLLSTNISYDSLYNPLITVGGWVKLFAPDSLQIDQR